MATEQEVQTSKEKGKEGLLLLRHLLKLIVKYRKRNHFSVDVGFAIESTWDPKATIRRFFRGSLPMLPAQQIISQNSRWVHHWACGNRWGYYCWLSWFLFVKWKVFFYNNMISSAYGPTVKMWYQKIKHSTTGPPTGWWIAYSCACRKFYLQTSTNFLIFPSPPDIAFYEHSM